MAVDALYLHGAMKNHYPIIPSVHMHSDKAAVENNSDWPLRPKIKSEKKLQSYMSDMPAVAAASYYYHTSTFPSLFTKLQSDQHRLRQADKFKINAERPVRPRPITTSKSWQSKQELKHQPNNDTLGARKMVDKSKAKGQPENKYRFIWSSINGVNCASTVERNSYGETKIEQEGKPNLLFKQNTIGNPESFKDTSHNNIKQDTANKFSERILHRSMVKLSVKPNITKSAQQTQQRSFHTTSRGNRLRSFSFVHFNNSAQNSPKPGRQRSFSISKAASSFPANSLLFYSPNKPLLHHQVTPLSSPRPWTTVTVQHGNRSSLVNKKRQTRENLKRKVADLGSKSSKYPSSFHHRHKTNSEVQPKTNHVRFSEDLTESRPKKSSSPDDKNSVKIPHSGAHNQPKWISSLSNDSVKFEEKSKTAALNNEDSNGDVSLDVTPSSGKNTGTKESDQTNELTPQLSLDRLRLRDRNSRTRTIDFLSTDQLIVRESIEKVQKWLRTLPKHFDAIHHVSSPAQQDY